ncbi:hypothetical protein NQZ68_010936 [Dissostichus eleginoides]|nr:hypothetical protein NQZ68_010936 [Dissostichus eleginoides]
MGSLSTASLCTSFLPSEGRDQLGKVHWGYNSEATPGAFVMWRIKEWGIQSASCSIQEPPEQIHTESDRINSLIC